MVTRPAGRVLIVMQQSETGASPEETLAELGRRVQKLFPEPG